MTSATQGSGAGGSILGGTMIFFCSSSTLTWSGAPGAPARAGPLPA